MPTKGRNVRKDVASQAATMGKGAALEREAAKVFDKSIGRLKLGRR